MADSDENLHRLEGTSGDAPGGLIIKKKVNPEEFNFAKPSLLGLDKLAAAKRKQNRLISFQNEENEGEDAYNKSGASGTRERKYRKHNEETPTYTGGLSEQARERMLERLQKKDKEQKGVHNSTKEEKNSRSKDEEDDRLYRSRYDKRDRDKDRREDDRKDRDRHRDDRDRRRDSERRDRDRDSYRRDRNTDRDSSRRSYYEPRFKDEPSSPSIRALKPTDKTAWDDDDEDPKTSVRKSSWDFPTPLTRDGPDRSQRSERRPVRDYKGRPYDNTPRATPHKNQIILELNLHWS